MAQDAIWSSSSAPAAPRLARFDPAARRRARAWARPVGYLGLLSVVGAIGFVALGSAGGDAHASVIVDTNELPEPGWVAGLLHGLAPALTATGFGMAMVVAMVGYLGVLLAAGELVPGWIWAAIVAVNLLMALAPPLASSDVFGYIAYARLGAVHHLNPYLQPPAAVPRDPAVPLFYWADKTSPYGPLFTLVSYPLGPLGLAAALWTLKALAAGAAVATSAAIWRCAARFGVDRARATAFVGLNPVVLVYAVGGAHNDVLVMLLLAWGVALLAARRSAGASSLIAAAAIKASALVVVPFALVGARLERRIVGATVSSVILAAAVTVAVFGSHIFDQVGSVVTASDFVSDYSGPDVVGRVLGTGVTGGVRAATLVAFLVVAAWQLARCWRGADWVAAAGWTTLAALLVVPSLVPWYLCWLVPLAALARSRYLAAATLLFSAALVAAHVPLMFGNPPIP